MIPKEAVDLGLYAFVGFLGLSMINTFGYTISRLAVGEWSNKRLEAFRARMYSSKISKVAQYAFVGIYQGIDRELEKRGKIKLEVIEELKSEGKLKNLSSV